MKTTNNKFRMQSPLFCDSSSSLNQTYLLRSTFARFHPCFSCSVVFFTWKCVKRLWSLSLFPSFSGLMNSLTQCPSMTISFLCFISSFLLSNLLFSPYPTSVIKCNDFWFFAMERETKARPKGLSLDRTHNNSLRVTVS